MNILKLLIQTYAVSLLAVLPISFLNASQLNKSNLLEFSLDVGNSTSDFYFPSNTYNTKTEILGINWYEPFTPYFHGGLELGYINLTQLDNNLASAQFTSGEYVGLLLRFIPISFDLFTLNLNANYRYHNTQGASTNQESRFVWNETLFSTELRFQPVSLLGLTAAAEYQFVDGSQRDSGTITQITTFSSSNQLGYRLGLNITNNRTGVIGFEWFSGSRSGTRIYFTRKF